MGESVRVLVGTTKGVFLLTSRDGRRTWDASGPHCDGWPINHVVGDAETGMLWAAGGGEFHGAGVWRSEDGGESWQAMRDGLPASNCFFTVLRQAMAVDRTSPTGVYFGTNSGSVFASRDRGAHWDEIARHLPTVLSVETVTA